MLNDTEIARLCHGRIIKAPFYNSTATDAAGPHYAVILDTDEQVSEHDSYYVAVISHNDQIDSRFIMPIPPRTGLTGFIVASWQEEAHLRAITQLGPKLSVPEMRMVLDLVRKYNAWRRSQKKS